MEVFVYGETAWQKRNGKLWARKVFESIYDGTLQYHLEYSNLIIYVAHTEVMFLSPDTYVSPVCPRSPKVLTHYYRGYVDLLCVLCCGVRAHFLCVCAHVLCVRPVGSLFLVCVPTNEKQ